MLHIQNWVERRTVRIFCSWCWRCSNGGQDTGSTTGHELLMKTRPLVLGAHPCMPALQGIAVSSSQSQLSAISMPVTNKPRQLQYRRWVFPPKLPRIGTQRRSKALRTIPTCSSVDRSAGTITASRGGSNTSNWLSIGGDDDVSPP